MSTKSLVSDVYLYAIYLETSRYLVKKSCIAKIKSLRL